MDLNFHTTKMDADEVRRTVIPELNKIERRSEIAARHAEWEITVPPEIREWSEDERYFNPWQGERGVPPIDNVGPIIELAGMVLRPRRRVAIAGIAG